MQAKQKKEVEHLISGCGKIAQTDYKKHHNKVAAMLYWNLCKKYELTCSKKWWEFKSEKVFEYEILGDYRIQTDKKLEHSRYSSGKQQTQYLAVIEFKAKKQIK